VALATRDEAALGRLADEVREAGGQTVAPATDVGDAQAVRG
jgi:hypothetical protein